MPACECVCRRIYVDNHICKLLIIYAHLSNNCEYAFRMCFKDIGWHTETHIQTAQPLVTIWLPPKSEVPTPISNHSPPNHFVVLWILILFLGFGFWGLWPEVLRWRYGYFSCQSKCALIATVMPSSFPNSHDPIQKVHIESNLSIIINKF